MEKITNQQNHKFWNSLKLTCEQRFAFALSCRASNPTRIGTTGACNTLRGGASIASNTLRGGASIASNTLRGGASIASNTLRGEATGACNHFRCCSTFRGGSVC